MQRTIRTRAMSFDINSNINPINKTRATYKDGGGLGEAECICANKRKNNKNDKKMTYLNAKKRTSLMKFFLNQKNLKSKKKIFRKTPYLTNL